MPHFISGVLSLISTMEHTCQQYLLLLWNKSNTKKSYLFDLSFICSNYVWLCEFGSLDENMSWACNLFVKVNCCLKVFVLFNWSACVWLMFHLRVLPNLSLFWKHRVIEKCCSNYLFVFCLCFKCCCPNYLCFLLVPKAVTVGQRINTVVSFACTLPLSVVIFFSVLS